MDEQEWLRVEKALSGTYGQVVLQIGEHTITHQRGLISNDRLGIVTYVNGTWRGEWMSGVRTYPEQQYLRRQERLAYTGKFRAAIKKISKRQRKEMGYDIDKKIHIFTPVWPSFSTLRRHYQKNFPAAKLVEAVG